MSAPTANTTTKRKPDWWIYAIPVLLALTVIFHLILFNGPGRLRLVIYYIGPLLVSFLAILFFIIGLIVSLVKRPFFSKWRAIGFVGLLLFPISFLLFADSNGNFFTAYPSSYAAHKSSVQYRLPLDGPIAVAWGGDEVSSNYHVSAPDQRWAYDLFVIREGKSFAGDSTKLESYFCYGMPVLAPAAGQVVTVSDTMPDMKIGELGAEPPHGNHIILKVAPKEYLFLCHLKPGSMMVKEGESVRQGQPLALVGNSGNTSEPHLHLHLQDTKELSFGEGIPLYFSRYTMNGKLVERGMPRGGFGEDGRFKGQVVENVE